MNPIHRELIKTVRAALNRAALVGEPKIQRYAETRPGFRARTVEFDDWDYTRKILVDGSDENTEDMSAVIGALPHWARSLCSVVEELAAEAEPGALPEKRKPFGPGVIRPIKAAGTWAMMNKKDGGFSSRCLEYATLDDLLAEWDVVLGKFGEDKHSDYIEFHPK